MIERAKRNIYEAFWKMGKIPLTNTIKIGPDSGGGKYEITAECLDMPSGTLDKMTPEVWQNVMDNLGSIRVAEAV